MNNKTFIIAEAGANHNKNKEQAFELIRIAKESGADAVKFQTYSSDTLYSKNTPDFAGYKNINKLIKDIELPREWQKDLKLFCDDIGIEFMSTPFDEKAVEELVSLGVKRLKIAGLTLGCWAEWRLRSGFPRFPFELPFRLFRTFAMAALDSTDQPEQSCKQVFVLHFEDKKDRNAWSDA